MYRQSCRSFVCSFGRGPLQVVRPVCALAAGAPTNAARDLAFLPAHLLYRAIHKCILSSLLPFCLSSRVARRLRSSRRLPSRLGSVCIAVSSSSLSSFPLPRSRPFFFPSTFPPHRPPLLLARAACSLLISLSFSLPPFLRPSVLRSVSSHRISTSSFKECREARV